MKKKKNLYIYFSTKNIKSKINTKINLLITNNLILVSKQFSYNQTDILTFVFVFASKSKNR